LSDYRGLRIAFTWPEGPIPPGMNDLEGALEDMITSAVDRIDFMSYSHNTDVDFILNKSLEDAIRRNRPTIRFYTDTEEEARDLLDKYRGLGSKIESWYWNRAGNPYSKFHLKCILVDNFNIYMGSANFSVTAMEDSAECGLFMRSRPAAVSLRNYISELVECDRLKRIPD
jgi:phosphatidylserine/phosphatidylglycerophosphate/cardiolipin synthase-like enzyme